MGAERIIIAAIALLLAACAGIGIRAALQPNGGCPKGTHPVRTGTQMIPVGKVIVPMPAYGCEAGQ